MTKRVSFHFLKSGLQTTIQDAGRPGFQEFGVPVGGAMDKRAMKSANWLVGNPLEHPVFEITLIGPKIEIEGTCQIALTGANLSPMINHVPAPMYETIELKNKDILSFGRAKSGCRAYLAVRGAFNIKPWLNSQSAAVFGGLLPESKINRGSILEMKAPDNIPKKKLPQSLRPNFPKVPVIRVLPGPEFGIFSRPMIAHFFGTIYRLSPDSNRMGYRLQPAIPGFDAKPTIISSGTVPGTVQVPPSGQPIILMMDAQTTGGYLRMVNVISADLDLLGQLKPGDQLRFQLVHLAAAQAARKEDVLDLK